MNCRKLYRQCAFHLQRIDRAAVIRHDTGHRYRRIPCAEPGSVAAGDGGLSNRFAPHLAGAAGHRGGPQRDLAARVARGDRTNLGGAGCLHQRHDGGYRRRATQQAVEDEAERAALTEALFSGTVTAGHSPWEIADLLGLPTRGALRRRRRAHPGTGQACAAGHRRQAAQPRHLFRLAAATRAADRHRAPAL